MRPLTRLLLVNGAIRANCPMPKRTALAVGVLGYHQTVVDLTPRQARDRLEHGRKATSLLQIEVIPAILVKTREEFLERIRLVAPYVSHVQWDIMDGKFVKNVTFSDPLVLHSLGEGGSGPIPAIEADLMVSDPQNWVQRLRHPGVDQLIFHVESIPANPKGLFEQARAAGFKVGLAAEPETLLDSYRKILEKVDRFQAMGGRSGFGGQEFNPKVLETIRKVRKNFPHLSISVDIGVNAQTAPQIVAAGANILVAGSYIFESDNVETVIRTLERAAEV